MYMYRYTYATHHYALEAQKSTAVGWLHLLALYHIIKHAYIYHDMPRVEALPLANCASI